MYFASRMFENYNFQMKVSQRRRYNFKMIFDYQNSLRGVICVLNLKSNIDKIF